MVYVKTERVVKTTNYAAAAQCSDHLLPQLPRLGLLIVVLVGIVPGPVGLTPR